MMKKIGKIIVVLTTFLGFMIWSEAQSVYIKLGDPIPGSRIEVYSKAQQTVRLVFQTVKNDNDLLYITDPFSVQYSASYQKVEDISSIYGNLSEDKMQKIKEIMYFGYGYKDRLDMKWYVATQVVIWEEILDENAGVEFLQTNSISFDEEIATLKADVAKFQVKPAFLREQRSSNNYQVKVKEVLTFVDENQVLDNYEVIPQDNMIVNVQDNEIKISFTKPGEYKVNLRSKLEKLNKEVSVYSDGRYIALERGDIEDDLVLGDFLVEEGKNSVTFTLTAGEEIFSLTQAGASYGLFNERDEMLETLVFQDDKSLERALEPGKYYLKQLKPPYGYKDSSKKINFTVDNTDLNVEIPLTLDKKSVTIKTPIARSLSIFTKAGELVFTWEQLANENKQVKLPYGEYILMGDDIMPAHFKIEEATTTKTITVKEKVENLEPEIPDLEVQKGMLVIKNVDKETGELIDNLVQVKIKNKETGEFLKFNGEEILNIEHGFLNLDNLEVGTYELLNISSLDNFNGIQEIEFGILEGENEVLNSFEKKKGFLIIKKIDRITKEPIKDSRLGIYNEKMELIKEIETDEAGLIQLELPIGIYFIKDLLNTSDYELNDDNIEVQIKDNIKSVLTISNRMKVKVPKTGVYDGMLVPFWSGGMLILGLKLKKYGKIS